MAKRGGFPGGMPGNMANLMKQAQKMQRQMEEQAKEMETKEFSATAGGGAVEATVSGTKKLLKVKLDEAMSLLTEHPELNITEISVRLGFSSPRYFSKSFKAFFGIAPQGVRSRKE